MKKLLLLVALIWSCVAAAQPSGVCGEEMEHLINFAERVPQIEAPAGIKNTFVAETHEFGELRSILGDEIYKVDSLIVIGPIDAVDFGVMGEAALMGDLLAVNLEKADVKDKTIPYKAFHNYDHSIWDDVTFPLPKIRSLILPDDIEVFEEGALFGVLMTSFKVPSSLRKLGKMSFAYCRYLRGNPLVLPEGIDEIPTECFYYCGAIDRVELPSTVKVICDGAFAYAGLREINLPDGLLAIKDAAFAATDVSEAIIPQSCQEIGEQVFSQAWYVKKAVIPEGITNIPRFAFYSNDIEDLSLPTTVEVISEWAFRGNSHLSKLDLPPYIKSIEREAFAGCDLDSVFLPRTLVYLGSNAFAGDKSVKTVCSESPVPPTCEDNKNLFGDPIGVTVYVPVGAGDLYRNAYGWSRYTIVESAEMGDAGIVDTAGDGQVKVSATSGGIVMHTAAAIPYWIYTAAGAQIAVGTVDGEAAVAAAPGIYIVKVGATATKIAVR